MSYEEAFWNPLVEADDIEDIEDAISEWTINQLLKVVGERRLQCV